MVKLFYQNLPERFELHPEYLMHVSLDAMIELGKFLRGPDDDFTNVEEFTRLLDKYPLLDYRGLSAFSTLYSPLQRTLEKNPAKPMRTVDDLVLEVKLLQYTLRDVPHLPPEQMKELKDFLEKATIQRQIELCGDYSCNPYYERERRRCAGIGDSKMQQIKDTSFHFVHQPEQKDLNITICSLY